MYKGEGRDGVREEVSYNSPQQLETPTALCLFLHSTLDPVRLRSTSTLLVNRPINAIGFFLTMDILLTINRQ